MQTRQDSGMWLVFGDIHDDLGAFARIPELGQADGIIISGDLTNLGGVKQAEDVMKQIEAAGLPVYAQIGNMDQPEVGQWLEETGHNIHDQVRELNADTAVFGIGGSTITPFDTPSEFPESAYAAWLEEMWPEASKFRYTVLVSHNPPKDTMCDDIGGDVHVGSGAVRKFIAEKQPDLCICGHIHEGRAVDQIGRTVIVNPGQLNQGGYVIMRNENGRLTAELAQVPVNG